jgi:hypothetical protein
MGTLEPPKPPTPHQLRQAHGVFPRGKVLYPWQGGFKLPDQVPPEPWMKALCLVTEDPTGLGLPNYWMPRSLLVEESVEPARSCTTCSGIGTNRCRACHPVELTMWEGR